jgi:hypothetical protein
MNAVKSQLAAKDGTIEVGLVKEGGSKVTGGQEQGQGCMWLYNYSWSATWTDTSNGTWFCQQHSFVTLMPCLCCSPVLTLLCWYCCLQALNAEMVLLKEQLVKAQAAALVRGAG